LRLAPGQRRDARRSGELFEALETVETHASDNRTRGFALVEVRAEPDGSVSAGDWRRRCGERGRTAVSVGEDGQLVD
jgi:hypothetical protein